MKSNKANFAGLTSPGQQSEMKAILTGTWPPLKPLPVFKYETSEYRATIDFDKKRGEWVCRKTSLPSNEVQELRGGLKEITLALPHGQAETFIEGAPEQELEFERETNRRLQAIREWRQKYESGTRYFELREFVSERHRAELDDSLRLTLTARQLQFNPKNAANVFDDLSVAGGRFAALIEFAKRKKENPGIGLAAQAETDVPAAETALNSDQQSLEISLPKLGDVLNTTDASNNDAPALNREADEHCADANELPALSIKSVSLEQEQTPLAERMTHAAAQPFEAETAEGVDADSASDAGEFPTLSIKNVFPEHEEPALPERAAHTAFQQFKIETSEIADEDSASLVEDPHPEKRPSGAFRDFGARVPTGETFADRADVANSSGDSVFSSSRLPALKISAFQVNVFAILLLFAVTSFTVGLTVGRGPLGKRLRDAPKSLLADDAKPPTLPDANSTALADQADESTSRIPSPPAAASDDSAGVNTHVEAMPSEEKSKKITRSSEYPADVRSADSDSSPTIESRELESRERKASTNSEFKPEHGVGIAPVVRNVPPRASANLVPPRKAARAIRRARRNRAPYRLTSVIDAEPPLPRPSAALVSVPGRGSQPFRVSFPEKTIAATSSLAMTSQLSVLVFPEVEPAARKSARLEAGELVSFGWPRYPRSGDRYGLAETIRVRARIGQFGQVEDVKFLSGSASLLPATIEAIRLWRYRPTLLDKRPVQTQQDITIEFRPPLYSSQLRTQHPPHN